MNPAIKFIEFQTVYTYIIYNYLFSFQVDDCFITFEEILQHAVKYQVDFILLGGDLFHHNKPSINCLNRCLDLLRRYCLGSK